MDESRNQQYSGVFNETQKERAKPFLKTVALFLVFCMLYQDVIAGAGSDYANSLKASYQKPTTVSKKNVLLSLLSGANSLVFGASAYAADDDPPPPPPKNNTISTNTTSPSKTSTPASQTTTYNVNASKVVAPVFKR
jgi:hypothetical protein